MRQNFFLQPVFKVSVKIESGCFEGSGKDVFMSIESFFLSLDTLSRLWSIKDLFRSWTEPTAQ